MKHAKLTDPKPLVETILKRLFRPKLFEVYEVHYGPTVDGHPQMSADFGCTINLITAVSITLTELALLGATFRSSDVTVTPQESEDNMVSVDNCSIQHGIDMYLQDEKEKAKIRKSCR